MTLDTQKPRKLKIAPDSTRKIPIVIFLTLLIAGCGLVGEELTSAGKVQSLLSDEGVACEEVSVRELTGEHPPLLMTCKDGSAEQGTYSFLIWESPDRFADGVSQICQAPLSSATANEPISITSNTVATSKSLLVDIRRISTVISGATSTWLDYCTEVGFTPTIEDSSGKSVEIPNVIGIHYQQALELLESNGLLVVRVFEKSDSAEGTVLRAEPKAGTLVRDGTAIVLYVSSGG